MDVRLCWFNRKCISFERFRVLVLDEVDEMKGRGFEKQVTEVLVALPSPSAQLVFFLCDNI